MTTGQDPSEIRASDGMEQHTGRAQPSATLPAAQPKKWQRILLALLDGRSLNRFQAARELRDHVLNTTISQLERRGLVIQRKDEQVPGHFGPVSCKRYWLSPESHQRAAELLGLPTTTPAPQTRENAL